MTFLNPLVLIGLIASSIPIIIHLLNLRKLKVIEFSSLKFLKEMQKNKMRKIRIKQLLLLVLRVLAITFLVLAFSRPAVKNISVAGLGSQVKSTVVILLDNSLSMSLSDKRGEYLNQAKQKAIEILNLAEEGDEIYFLKLSELNPQEEKFNPVSKGIAERLIRSTEISFIRKNYSDALICVSKILEATTNISKEIFLISDLQRTNIPNSELSLERLYDANTMLYVIDIGTKTFTNYSVDSIQIRDKIFELSKPLNLQASITNYNEANVLDLNTNLYLNAQKSSQKGVDIPAKNTKQIEFSGKLKESGFVPIKIEIEDDDFLYDNSNYSSVYVPEKIKILLATDSQQEAGFISLALSQKFEETSQSIIEINQTTPSLINSFNFEKYDIIFLVGIEGLNVASKLKSFVENGGRIILLPTSKSNPITFNNFTQLFEISNMQGVSGSKTDKNSFNRFDKIDFAHPIMQNIFQDESKRKIESPKIYYSFNYKPSIQSTSIIDLQNSYSFLIEHRFKLGKMFLFTTALDFNWSDFALKGIFLPLLNRLVVYASAQENKTASFIVGENFSVNLPRTTSKNIKLIFPDGREKILETIQTENNSIVEINGLDIPGNYRLVSENNTVKMISINLDPLESNLAKVESFELEKFVAKISKNLKLKIFPAERDIVQSIKQERLGTELWKFFLVLTLACLALEMIIARSSKKDLINNA
ncbi:MAG: VWA domain-containing protein [Ignavibacteria bacterium]|nr:VWA domain-containing protein [Ignavibacteria bacterium]